MFTLLDFLAAVSAHIPDPHEKTRIFYGWYSNRTRGDRRQRGLLKGADGAAGSAAPDAEAPGAIRSRLIRKVYEVDPLLCPRCGGTLRVIAVLDAPDVLGAILDHLGIARRF